MQIEELIREDQLVTGLQAADKKQVLEQLSAEAAKRLALDQALILNALKAREDIGATAVGHGVALPHATIPGLAGLFALFASLDRPVDFDAYDGESVDLVFVLLSPSPRNKAYLPALAAVARRLGDGKIAGRLRKERDRGRLYSILTGRSAAAISA